MTLRTAAFQTVGTDPAEDLRAGLVRGFTGMPGVVGSTAMLVTANGTPNFTVNIAQGGAIIPGSQNAPTQGFYSAWNDAVVNVNIAAAPGANSRIDLVCVLVDDRGGGYAVNPAATTANAPQFIVVTGVAAPSPSVPAVPANALPLAKIAVASSTVSITSGLITDVRPFACATGGTLAMTSTQLANQIASAFTPGVGQCCYQTDTGKELFYYGATTLWQQSWQSAWALPAQPLKVTAWQLLNATSYTDVTGLTALTFAATLNRVYELKALIPGYVVNGPSKFFINIYNVTSSTQIAEMGFTGTTAGDNMSAQVIGYFTAGATASVTFKVQMRMGGAAMSFQTLSAAGIPAVFSVVDIGPASTTPPSP
jgi:hypothetical protein